MGFDNILGIINNVANDVARSVGNEISGILSNTESDVTNYVIKPLNTDIENALSGVSNALNILEHRIQSNVVGMLVDVGAGIQNTENTITQGFDRALGIISSTLNQVASDIKAGFESELTNITSGFELLKNGIETEFGHIVSGIETGFHDVGVFILKGITEIMDPFIEFLKTIPSDIINVAKTLETTISKGVESRIKQYEIYSAKTLKANQALIKTMGHMPKVNIIDIAKEGITKYIIDNLATIIGIDINKVSEPNLLRLIAATSLEASLGEMLSESPSAAFLVSNALTPIMNVALAGAYRNLRYAGNSATPNEILSMGTLIMGKYKGYISDDRFYSDMASNGISQEVADKMYNIEDMLLGMGELITLYRRGIMKDKDELYKRAGQVKASKFQVDSFLELYDKLLGFGESVELWRRDIKPDGWSDFFDDVRAGGITDNRIDALKEASYTLPSVTEYQDFIRRGVFDETLSEKYKYDYELDENYFKLAKARGYDRKTAKALYRKYWEVPPFFITEGLFKSGKLEEKDFRDMLTLEGYTPYWIDRLVSNLKPTLTSGDVKNLYKYQLITYEQIPKQLQDIGIPVALSLQYQQLWRASVSLASSLDQTSNQVATQKIKTETEGLIKSAYIDKIINKEVAETSLKNIGYANEEATLILDIADYKQKNKDLSVIAETVGIELRNKSITITDAITQIQAAGATALQLDKYTAEYDRIAAVKDKMPTKAEFEHWYKKGLISPKQLAEGFSLLGYSNTWIPYFLLENGVTKKVVATLFPKPSITL